ncbi:hypothetical protein, partial [Streptomyces sp. JV190]|uniref:hypothetical protein n=1 Tax=Streptomyces sp. JV190 TaxID=3002533 RepID=UPI002E7993B0
MCLWWVVCGCLLFVCCCFFFVGGGGGGWRRAAPRATFPRCVAGRGEPGLPTPPAVVGEPRAAQDLHP